MSKLLEAFPNSFSKNLALVGMTNEFFSLYVNAIFPKTSGIIIVTPTLYEANKIYNSLSAYNSSVYLYQLDRVFLSSDLASDELKVERLTTLNALLENNKRIVITDVLGYLAKIPKKNTYQENIISLEVNQEISLTQLVEKLSLSGYVREILVTETGEIGVRGFVLDIYPVGENNPVRIEFFGDTIESIRYFDVDSQKSIQDLTNIVIYPNDISNYQSDDTLLSYFNEPVVIFKDYDQLQLAYNRLLEDYNYYKKEDSSLPFYDFSKVTNDFNLYYLDFDTQVSIPLVKYYDFQIKEVEMFNENIEKINAFLKANLKGKNKIIFCLDKPNQTFFDLLEVPYIITDLTSTNWQEHVLNIVYAPLNKGFAHKDFYLFTPYELFNHRRLVTRKAHFKYGSKISSINELEIGDYVVHQQYGIGVYNGLKTLKKKDIVSDYLEVLYDKGDKLYIPASKIELISKYSGKDGYVPKINALNSTAWLKTKQKVREKIKYEASRLLRVQAERQLKKGFAFSKDSPMQVLFESEFPYEITQDQLRATEEIKKDMESSIPMDRILCGDVGYGKTEVAFRAMFKAVLDSKQVFYLCPTTLLCKQQYDSAKERFKNFPVKIAMFSRYTTAKEATDLLKEIKEGTVDIVIGTHRLLNDAVKPKDLGLLIIDEEQRFGVAHKEKIKEFKSNIDVLTLTATPIPRTLQMAMLGIKNLSLIETPPKNRHPVQTYVIAYDPKLIRDIIYKEISRDGQVFILYNRVEDIELELSLLKRLAPDANINYAHGRMTKQELEDRISSFINREYDVLLCTTIIETGIDIPNVNSLIILNADRFGLAQLYQIRGRVGRSDRVAYAYLMYDKAKVLTEQAMKRLKVIKDFTALGSGFHIATRDLSIRGAGDILGSEQAGFIDTVGIDLYMKMLSEEILRLKNKKDVENTERAEKDREVANAEDQLSENVQEEKKEENTFGTLNIGSHIDTNYVNNEALRIAIHKLINSIDSSKRYMEVKAEIEDRFGKIDKNTDLYMNEQLFESFLKKKGVSQVIENNLYVEIIFSKEASNLIDYQELFVKSLRVTNLFKFQYSNDLFHIKLLKKGLDKHPVYYFNKLLEQM